MGKWIRKPRKCEHCHLDFFARGPKRFCKLECELLGSIAVTEAGCWEWQRSRVYGYGQVRTDQTWRYRRAHRVAFEQWIGPIAGDLCVCHRCDNKPCINPAHLFLGTTQENTADKVAKGRQQHSEDHPKAKLSRDAVAEILAAPPRSGRRLAQKYGVTPAAICSVRKRKNWKHYA